MIVAQQLGSLSRSPDPTLSPDTPSRSEIDEPSSSGTNQIAVPAAENRDFFGIGFSSQLGRPAMTSHRTRSRWRQEGPGCAPKMLPRWANATAYYRSNAKEISAADVRSSASPLLQGRSNPAQVSDRSSVWKQFGEMSFKQRAIARRRFGMKATTQVCLAQSLSKTKARASGKLIFRTAFTEMDDLIAEETLRVFEADLQVMREHQELIVRVIEDEWLRQPC